MYAYHTKQRLGQTLWSDGICTADMNPARAPIPYQNSKHIMHPMKTIHIVPQQFSLLFYGGGQVSSRGGQKSNRGGQKSNRGGRDGDTGGLGHPCRHPCHP